MSSRLARTSGAPAIRAASTMTATQFGDYLVKEREALAAVVSAGNIKAE